MKKTLLLAILIFAICLLVADVFPTPALPFNPLSYTACKATGELVMDGILDEDDWQKTPWTEEFVDIEGELKPLPFYSTRAKILWDDDYLYIAARMEEPHIWATLTQRDAVIFHDNDFEVFIDPDGDTHDYYELEINALGTLWDLFLIKPYRDRQQVAINAWDIRGIQYGIHLEGTLNDPSDIDTAWQVEMKIPMSVLAECAHKPTPPPHGDWWRLNFSRVHWDTQIVDGMYQKIAGKPEYNWVWSPQGLIAMHYPERWGYLFFAHQPAGTEVSFSIPAIEYRKESLRQLYYLQKQYQYDHGSYARSLCKLKLPSPLKKLKPKMESTSFGYVITLPAKDGFPQLHIREDGLLWETP
ncbi:MAG: carbohydrate-binding family 9-like protein [Candidatus Cloacimonetes bacterium]|nr:carbohydrate-binding family 9-like protein [Candidatus Cloacimonadota bacterium]NLO11508.1 carbohydrate-binding family 9-like protein [Candidatus Cloacimonadota bacterium]